MLRVREIFPTIQGEGRWTGAPALFVRLQGCDVGCPWCDTKESWPVDAEVQMVIRGRDLALHLLEERNANPAYHRIVLTGGEPCIYDLRPATGALHGYGFRSQIETSGTYPVKCHNDAWVTVSPKWDMPGGREVLDEALGRANELKCVVGKPEDVERAVGCWTHYQRSQGVQLFLQPLWGSQKALELCVVACQETGAHLSVQSHKYLGLP